MNPSERPFNYERFSKELQIEEKNDTNSQSNAKNFEEKLILSVEENNLKERQEIVILLQEESHKLIKNKEYESKLHDDSFMRKMSAANFGEDVDMKQLNRDLLSFKSSLESSINKMVEGKKAGIEKVIEELKNLFQDKSINLRSIDIPTIIGMISALWSGSEMLELNIYENTKGLSMGQMVAILRILGRGYKDNSFANVSPNALLNNLIQLGKTTVVGIVSAFLALCRKRVYCACYTEDLGESHSKLFDSFFKLLGVDSLIKYGTINKLCETIIEEKFNIRKMIASIAKNKSKSKKIKGEINEKEDEFDTVLFIEEFEVLFEKDFLGCFLKAETLLKDKSIDELVQYIWENRETIDYNDLHKTEIFAKCQTIFDQWSFLIMTGARSMIKDLKNYVQNNRDDYVVYNEANADITNKRGDGYKNLWNYYQEGKTNKSIIESDLGIKINLGNFCYSELPNEFGNIIGISGTLETFTKNEKQMIRNKYKIISQTNIPSLYGDRNYFIGNEDVVKIFDRNNYFMQIKNEILNSIGSENNQKCLLVFFKDPETLNEFSKFFNCQIHQDMQVQIISNNLEANDKTVRIRKATTPGIITLLLKDHVREFEFLCGDREINTKGGIGVIQTFFSEKKSEEILIRSLKDCHGDEGTYVMILLDKELNCLLKEEQIGYMFRKSYKYEILDMIRSEKNNKSHAELEEKMIDDNKFHLESMKLVRALELRNAKEVRESLVLLERREKFKDNLHKTLILLDATASMEKFFEKAKQSICELLTSRQEFLRRNNIPKERFKTKIVCYRNYNSGSKEILNYSAWESNEKHLFAFLDYVKCQVDGVKKQ